MLFPIRQKSAKKSNPETRGISENYSEAPMFHLRKSILAVAALLILSVQAAWGYYLQDSFANTANWIPQLRYSMRMGVWGGHQATGRTNWFAGAGKLQLTGWVDFPFTAGASSEFYGISAMFTNTKFNPTKENPFGYEITRQYVRFSPGLQSYRLHMLNFSMVQWDPSVTNYGAPLTVQGTGPIFPNSVAISEVSFPYRFSNTFYTWNQAGTESPTTVINNWAAVTNESGNTLMISNAMVTNYHLATGNAQTNPVTFRIVHDGETVSVWVNPNGCQGTANEFYFAGQFPAAFATNVIPLFNASTLTYDTIGDGAAPPAGSSNIIHLSNFLIRSAVSNLTSELYPSDVVAGSSNHLRLVLHPQFSSVNEAGVGEIYVDLPDSYTNFTNWTAYINNGISVHYATTNGQIWKSFANSYRTNNPAATGTVAMYLRNNNKQLRIRFYSGGTCDYFHPDNLTPATVNNANTNVILLVISNFKTDTAADSSGKTFTVWINNEKYKDTAWTKTATTSKSRSYAGDAMQMSTFGGASADGNGLTIRTYDNQVGLASISPLYLYEGTPTTVYLNVRATNITTNNADINIVHFTVPNGFTVDPSSFSSYILTNPSASIKLVGTPTDTNIWVYYSNENRVLSPNSSGDTIRFNIFATPAVPAGNNNTNVSFTAECLSLLSGTTNTNVLFNAIYPTLTVLIKKKPPNGEAYFGPDSISNTTLSNNFQLVFRNKAPENGNNWLKLRVWMSPSITNVKFPVTSTPAFITNISDVAGLVGFDIDYQATNRAISNGLVETLSFSGMSSVPALSADTVINNFQVSADNGNGDFFLPLNEASEGLDCKFYTPPSQIKARILYPNAVDVPTNFTHFIYSDVSTNALIQFNWQNIAEANNDIDWVAIAIPNQITNFSFDATTTRGFAVSTNSIASIGLTNVLNLTNYSNVLLVNYTTNRLKATPVVPDQVSIRALDKVTDVQDAPFVVFSKNTTNYSQGQNWNAQPNDLVISYLYSPPSAAMFVTVPSNYIEAATSNGTISVTITNTGRPDNLIRRAIITLPPTDITNITAYSSSKTGIVSYDQPTGTLTVNYDNIPFGGGQSDTITMTIWDSVETEARLYVTGAVRNNRSFLSLWPATNIGVAAGKTNLISINRPRTMYSYSTTPSIFYNKSNTTVVRSTNVLNISVSNRGWGSNRLNKVRIPVPSFLTGRVLMVSNSLGWTNETSGNIQINNDGSQDFVNIDYVGGGNPILPDGTDSIQLWIDVHTNLSTNLYWTVMAANNSTADVELCFTDQNEGQVFSGQTNILTIMNLPLSYIQPNLVLTPLPAVSYTNKMKFIDPQSREITKVRLGLSTSFYSKLSNIAGAPSWITNTAGGTNYLEVFYTNSPINDASSREISFIAYDLVASGNTNTGSTFEVDFGDGAGYRPTATEATYSRIIGFTNPLVKAGAGVTPNSVSHDFTSNAYTVLVRNTGSAGNDIQIVKIVAPPSITNITAITSTPIAASFITNSNNNIYLYYTNTPLQSGQDNNISFLGWDNVDPPATNSESWTVMVDNTAQNVNEQSATVLAGKSLASMIVKPDYRARVFVEATNWVDSPEKVYSTGITNYFRFSVNNSSGTGNNLTALQIIPDPSVFGAIIDTNSMRITNLVRTTGVTNYFSNNIIWVIYTTNLLPTEYDEILIRANDLLTHSNATLTFDSAALFTSTYTNFKPTVIASGKSNIIRFVMPEPSASMAVSPDQIYMNKTNFNLTVAITNTGSGSADFDYAEIWLPNEFTNGFDASDVSGTIATNVVVSVDASNRTYLQLYYNNLPTGSNDTVILNLTNLSAFTASVNVDVVVRDYISNSISSPLGNNSVFLCSVPTFYLTPNTNGTELASNTFTVNLNNDVSGTLAIQKVKLEFPPEFTNYLFVSSSRVTGSEFSGDATNIVIDYSGAGFANGENDVVELELYDSLDVGNLGRSLTAWVDDGKGYVPMALTPGRSSNISFIMPAANAVASLSPSEIYQNKDVFQLAYTVSNTGSGLTPIEVFTLKLPKEFTNGVTPASFSSPKATNIEVLTQPSGMVVNIAYTNVLPDSNATVTMTLTNGATNAGDYVFELFVYNGANTGVPTGTTNLRLSTVPGLSISPTNIDSSTETNQFVVKINNLISGTMPVKKVRIAFPSRVVSAVATASDVIPVLSAATTNGTPSAFEIDYSGDTKQIAAGSLDQVAFTLVDDVTIQNIDAGITAEVNDGNGYVPMSLVAGSSTNLYYRMPAPAASVSFGPDKQYLNRPVFTLGWTLSNTGTGSSDLDRFTLVIPNYLSNNLQNAAVTGTTATNTNFHVVGGRVQLDLDYDHLAPGQTDHIDITFTNAAPSNMTLSFGAYVRNYVNTAAATGATNLSITPIPTFRLTPNEFDTSTWSNRAVLNVDNSASGAPIHEVKFVFPAQFTNFSAVGDNTVSTNFVDGNDAQSVMVHYISNGKTISAGDNDSLTLNLFDSLTVGNLTNGILGYVSDGYGFVPMLPASAGATNIMMTNPLPSATIAVTPNQNYMNRDYFALNLLLTNTGTGTSALDRYMVGFPPDFTNGLTTSSVTNTAATNIMLTNFGGYRWLVFNYANLSAGADDSIWVFVSNSVTNSKTNTLTNVVRNTTWSAAPAGSSSIFLCTVPKISVTPQTLDSSSSFNRVTVVVNNGINGTLDMKQVELRFPIQVTNVSLVSAEILPMNRTSGTPTNFLLDYMGGGKAVNPGDQDVLVFDIYDTNEIQNISNGLSARVSRNGTNFVNMQPATAGATNLFFQMPQPSAAFGMTPAEIPQNRASFMMLLAVTNTGVGSSSLDRVSFIIPANLTNGLKTNQISNSLATNIVTSHSAPNMRLDFYYSNLAVGAFDNIYLKLSNTSTKDTNLVISAIARDFVYSSNMAGFGDFLISTIPTFSLTPNTVDTSTASNRLELTIKNDINGALKIKQLKIILPPQITNYRAVSSLIAPTNLISGPGSNILVDYESNGLFIAAGDNDLITIDALDGIDIGDLDTGVEVWASAGTNFVTNRDGFVRMGLTSGKSTNLFFQMPQPSAAFGMTPGEVPQNRGRFTMRLAVTNTGTGSSALDLVSFSIPAYFTNGFVTNRATNSKATNIVINQTDSNMWVDFLYAGLATNDTDLIFLDLTNTSPLSTNIAITGFARNFINSSNMTGSGDFLISKVPTFSLTPNLVDTSSSSNRLELTVNNDINGALKIKQLKIVLPAQITNYRAVSSVIAPTNLISGNRSNILVDYDASGLFIAAGDNDIIDLDVLDNLDVGDLNTGVEVWASDGTGFVKMGKTANKFTNLFFQMPRASANFAMTPGEIFYNLADLPLTLRLSNTGSGSSWIDRLTLKLPAAFSTGMAANRINSVLAKTNYFATSFGQATLTFEYTNLAPGVVDTITLRVSNISTNTTNYSVEAIVRNIQNSDPVTGGTNIFLTTLPNFTVSPNGIDTSTATNRFTVRLNNNINGAIRVQKMKLSFPAPFSSYVTVTNTTVGNSAVSGTTTNLVVDYSSAGRSVAAGDSDDLTVDMLDSLLIGGTNIWVNVWVNDGNGYIPVPVKLGNTNRVAFVMPPASASAYLTPTEVPVNKTYIDMTLAFTNTGTGSSGIDQMTLDIPSDLAGGVSTASFRNTIATISETVIATGKRYTFQYTNLPAGAGENILFRVTNNAAATTNVTFDISVRNFINTGSPVGSNGLFLSQVPTFYLAVTNADTAVLSNIRVQVYLENSQTGTARLRKAVLRFPSWVTNVVPLGSTMFSGTNTITFNRTNGSELVVDYAAAGSTIAANNNDILTFLIDDNFEVGNTNGAISMLCDNGPGLSPMVMKPGAYSTNILWQMPDPSAWLSVLPQKIYLTTTTNTMQVKVSNTSYGSSRFQYARVDVPVGLVNLANPVSSRGGTATIDPVSNAVLVDYTSLPVNPGLEDTISFDFSNTLVTVTNINVKAWVANMTPPNYQASLGVLGSYSLVQVTHPPVGAQGYVYGNNNLYLIETNGTIIYRVINRTYDTQVTNVTIRVGTNIAFDRIIASDISGKALSLIASATESNTFIATFPNTYTNFGYLDNCDFKLEVLYHLTNTGAVKISGDFSVIGATNVTNVPTYLDGNNTATFVFTNSMFGAVQGQVFPALRSVDVKFYKTGETVIATNAEGASLIASSGTNGWYLAKKVPTGIYRMEFSQTAYRATNITIDVPPNQVTNISLMQLRNAPLVTGGSNQSVLCYDQTNSRVELPANAVKTGFSIDIVWTNLTDEQITELSTNHLVKAPTPATGMRGYFLELRDFDDRPIQGATLELDATMIFAYDKTDIAARGWSEDNLAIFYWDDRGGTATGQWVRIGGTVDTTNGTVIANVSYVHRLYAVMEKGSVSPDVIQNVTIRPKIFTPSINADNYYGSIRITFEMDPSQAPNGYKVKIYSIKGSLIREFERNGTYRQGEVSWDGKDRDSFPVKSGVYIYRIQAGTAVYSGTIIIAR